jgi:hypothetical protein
MGLIERKLAVATAVAAAFSLAATPATAVDMPRPADAPQVRGACALEVENRRPRGHHHDDWDIDGDDILAGVLILGGIAAISAIANSGRNREPSQPEPEQYPDDAGYQPEARDERYRSGGMAEAVEVCVSEVEAGRGPVGSVDRASRSGEGWYVAGELDGGTPYACWIDGAGRVTDIEAGDYGADYQAPAAEEGGVALAPVRKQMVDDDRGEAGFEVARVGE